jgi:hypothetical protein
MGNQESPLEELTNRLRSIEAELDDVEHEFKVAASKRKSKVFLNHLHLLRQDLKRKRSLYIEAISRRRNLTNLSGS